MPLYEYKCDQCGDVFEVMQKFSDEPLSVHTKCGGPVHRILSPPALQFKGSGWYVTDYAKNTGGDASKKSGSETKPASESKTGSKPADTKSSSSEKSKPD